MKKSFRRVALIGLDGSGKSTNIDNMKMDADYSSFKFVWVRWKPILLKPIYLIMNKRVFKNRKEQSRINAQEMLNSDYHIKFVKKRTIFKNPLIRNTWMALALIDYFIQFQLKSIILLHGNKNVIFDRLFIDLFVDQGINFGYSPEKIDNEIKKYQWLFPKMNQIIYIRVSPETCFKRKDDIPNMDYLQRRYDIYEKLCQNPNWVSVDGEASLHTVNNNIKQLIFK